MHISWLFSKESNKKRTFEKNNNYYWYNRLKITMENIGHVYPNKKMADSYEDEEERKHFQRIVSAFKYYKSVLISNYSSQTIFHSSYQY